MRKKSKRRKRDKTVLLALLVSLIIIGSFTYFGYQLIIEGSFGETKDEDVIRIDDYVGKDYNEVKPELEAKGVTVKVNFKANEEVDKDIIMNQDVAPGKTFRRGGMANIITFDVSLGAESVVLPNFKNQDSRTAERELKSMGMDFVVRLEGEYSEDAPVNHVIRTNPGEGVTVGRGTEIIIYFSKGPQIEWTEVPDVIGKTLSEAQELILEANLKVGTLTPDDEISQIAPIIKQIPQAGAEVEEDTPVQLYFDIDSVAIEKPYTIQFSNRNKYGNTFRLYVEFKQYNSSGEQTGAGVLINDIISRDDLPKTIDVPVFVNGYTEVRVLVGTGPRYTRYELEKTDVIYYK